VRCLNQFDLIRKYRCDDCAGVAMCACDEETGRRFLSHQLREGADFLTHERIPVTLGFQPGVCPECRGLPAEPAPAGEIHGRTSKIKRYYWREIFFEEMRRRADWEDAHPDASPEEAAAAREAIERAALDEIKALHATKPKYVFTEPSQAEILERYHVEIATVEADYVDAPQKGAVIRDGDRAISPEAFVTRLYEQEGWSILPFESRPIHVLFGTMMWLLIQDTNDPMVRMVGFGNRTAYEAGEKPPVIWSFLPEDFGSAGYGQRRAKAIERHFKTLPPDRSELLWAFDYWQSHSEDFRQYLWAHREDDVARARKLVEVLPPGQIIAILRYLVADYWGRYLGWPDLLAYRGNDFIFLEVKSSGDKLTQDQRRWIEGNHNLLGLPFRLVKLVRPRQAPAKQYTSPAIR
jgi:hypothetical protein